MKFSVENILWRREIPFLLVSSLLLLLGGMVLAQAEVVLVSGEDRIDLICGDEGSYKLLGSNDDGIPGTFELIEANTYLSVPGHILDNNLLDDMAELVPSGLSGDYGVIYSYEIDMAVMGDTCWFTVDATTVELPDLPETVCKNDVPYDLIPVTDPPDPGAVYSFSGPGVTGNQQDGYLFNPANDEVPVGPNTITLNYTASNGCQKNSTFTVNVSYVPVISFYYSPSCISPDGQEVSFTNTSSGKFSVERWDWNFGDPESGSANSSTLVSPNHYYPGPGSWVVNLTATTYDACEASSSRNIVLKGKPLVDFSWLHDCFISGDSTAFLNSSVSNTDIDELIWKISNSSGDLLHSIWSNQPEDTIWATLSSQEQYSVNLFVKNESGCSDESTRSIRLKPLYSLSSAGYTEAFDGEGLDWEKDSETGNVSWELGTPDFTGFTAGEGDLSWYTDLPVQTTGYIENSWVESPCFDLSKMNSPMIQLDLMRSFVPGTDGAVLQYQDLVTEGWKTIGTVGRGMNWYNSWGIFNEPGGSNFGWGLPVFQPDTEWLRAGYPIDSLARKPFVKFRVVIGTGGTTQALGNQGFAFDNFFLGERVRTSLLEHFTNSASQAALDADLVVSQLAKENDGMLIDLQYHMDYPGEDSMNLNNPEPPSVRAFNYGVPTVPYALLNGGTDPTYRYDFSDVSEKPDDGLVLLESLKVPPFNMDLTVDYANYKLVGDVNVRCSAASYASNIQLYVVVIEELLTAYTGVSEADSFRNVVLDMLPTPAGKLLGNDWILEDSAHLSFQWDYASYVEDIDELSVVAYLFDRDQNLVLQAAEYKYSPPVGISPLPDPGRVMAIYPNPARDFVYVNMGSEATIQGELRIVDASGRLLMMADVSPGQVIRQLDIASLDQGFYLVQWIESGRVKGYGSLIRMR